MAEIGFIGVGNMGAPMARNLVRADHNVRVFDRDTARVDAVAADGARATASLAQAVAAVDVVITMLPTGAHVRAVYEDDGGVLASASPGALLIDCSTIDVASARAVAEAASARGFAMLDAPVSGGVGGAEAATLTFMVGGAEDAVARARLVLEAMGRTVVPTGAAGTGQAAKLCNNLILGVSMTAVAEAFTLADALGLERQKLFDVSAASSGQCWALTTYCPVPGPVPGSPANRDYAPGFAAEMMLKDLELAQAAAREGRVASPLGAVTANLFQLLRKHGWGKKDFSVIIKLLEGTDDESR